MNIIKGKALLVVTKRDSPYVPFSLDLFIQSCSGNTDDHSRAAVEEAFYCAVTDTLPMPSPAYKMKDGDQMTFSVVYVVTFTTDYWGESYCELEYLKVRTLRKRPWTIKDEKRYQREVLKTSQKFSTDILTGRNRPQLTI